jgi:SpoVK/Ycf46/Vps4 family AAA+-type ATPase
LECRLRSNLEFPAAKTLPQIEKNLFSADEHPRRRLNVSIALYSRHGCAEPSFVDSVPFEFNDSQVQALEKMRTFLQGPERVFVLTGAAGTGKTALFPAIVGLVQESGHCVQLMAPTGQASRRLAKIASLGASTVHATIYIDATHLTTSGNEQSSELTGNIEQFALTPSLVEDADESPPVSVFELREPPSVPVVYIIDEASLIGNRQVERQGSEVVFADGMLLSDLIKFTLSHPDSRVIFVGDPWQLPPIGEQFSPALECDELERITGCLPAFATLTQVMRQDERSAVLDLADRASIATIHGGFDTGPDDPEAGINLLGSDLLPGWVNSALIRGEAVVIAARNADVARWNKSIRKAADLPLDKLNQGDLVSVLRRDSQRNIQNGDDLIVESLTDQIVPITVKGETVTLREAVFRFDMHGVGPVLFNALFVEDLLYQASADDKQRITRLLFIDFRMRHKDLKPNTESFNLAYDADARVNALRVCYSYARTCHRAQGGEWPQVVVDFTGSRWLGPSFGRWAYTAVTRPKRSIWLASIPSTGAPLGADALADGAKLVLQAIGFDNVTLRPIQYGVQLKISRAGSTLGVNLYEKKGRPSSVEVTGSSAPAFTDDVVQALKGWVIDMNIKAMDPLPEKLEEIYVVLGSEFQEAGYDLLIQPYAAYQAKFILKDAVSREASAICSYKGNGFLSYIQMLEGDLALQQKLREALECVIA